MFTVLEERFTVVYLLLTSAQGLSAEGGATETVGGP